MKQISIHSGDIPVALQLALTPLALFSALAKSTGRSIGEVHNAISRLQAARIVMRARRAIVVEPLLRFIQWGVPYSFPPVIGGMALGVETARLNWSEAETSSVLGTGTANPARSRTSEYVWPSAEGETRGQALAPLYTFAPRLARTNSELCLILSRVDLIRIGGAREGSAAIDAIAEQIGNRGE